MENQEGIVGIISQLIMEMSVQVSTGVQGLTVYQDSWSMNCFSPQGVKKRKKISLDISPHLHLIVDVGAIRGGSDLHAISHLKTGNDLGLHTPGCCSGTGHEWSPQWCVCSKH